MCGPKFKFLWGSLQINKIINSTIDEYKIPSDGEFESKIEIIFVSKLAWQIRGFAGNGKIYGNIDHFMDNWHQYNEVVETTYLKLLLKLDIISLVLHEYAHLRLRKVCKQNVFVYQNLTTLYLERK